MQYILAIIGILAVGFLASGLGIFGEFHFIETSKSPHADLIVGIGLTVAAISIHYVSGGRLNPWKRE